MGNDADRFLLALFSDVNGSFIEQRIKAVKSKKWRASFYNSTAKLAQAVPNLAETHDEYVGIATRRDDSNGKKENLDRTAAVFIELDVGEGEPYATLEEALEAVRGFPLRPSMVVKSGSGLHVYWLLKEPWPLDNPDDLQAFEAVTYGLGVELKADAGTWDASRVLRIPGTQWHKEQPPRNVRLAELNDRRYNLSDFEPWARTPPAQAEPVDFDADADAEEAMLKAEANRLPARIWRLITEGHPDGSDRSRGDFAVCCDLVRAGLSVDEIRAIFQAHAVGQKYHEPDAGDRYLGITIGKARAAVENDLAIIALEGANAKSVESLTDEEIEKHIRGPYRRYGASHESRAATEIYETDLGNAQRLVRRHGDDLRYCFPWGRWLHWEGSKWGEDDTGEIARRAKETVQAILAEAATATLSRSKELARHAIRSQAEARIDAMMTLARSEPGIPVIPSMLDADPWLLNVVNGTLDLHTGELREHRREDLITKLAPVSFDREARCPIFLGFLDRIFAGNQAIIGYVKRTLGRALTGDVSEQRLEVWHGVGANGKTTLMNAVLYLLDTYGKMAAPGLLLRKYGDRHPTEVADLKGARFVACVEVGEGRKLAEEIVKQLTGGDRRKARRMRQDYWEYEATDKIFVACNHKPTIAGTDWAIWRRVKLVPFAVIIPEREQDKALSTRLRAEAPGILNWLIEGCLEWQSHGLGEPAEITEATAGYRAEQDVIAAFLDDCCVLGDDKKATAKALYHAYSQWAKETGETPLCQRDFGKSLSERGFTSRRTGSQRWWFGVGLVTHPDLN